ncbi:unnamed protein product [Orchesella dallaii]|uniref:C2H2-type domain-containing protein n=1 Tax=Orchesella dallaii TaxID=48710 RepID=A0ABP1PV43_9HEXA
MSTTNTTEFEFSEYEEEEITVYLCKSCPGMLEFSTEAAKTLHKKWHKEQGKTSGKGSAGSSSKNAGSNQGKKASKKEYDTDLIGLE